MKKRIGNIEEFAQYLDDMRFCYGWSEEEWRTVAEQITRLKHRCGDPRLYLGVVGEFSSGKSTFINALLGLDLLKEDILPGTTCAPTLLAYGKQFEVEIYGGKSQRVIRYTETFSIFKKIILFFTCKFGKKRFLNRRLEEAKAFIHRYSADEDMARKIFKVIIFLPHKCPILKNNVVIVDTPGINSENPRHQEVTAEAVRDLCDLAIILTPAPSPCSCTLLSFLAEHLGAWQKYCVCLVSQMDRLRKAERMRQIKYISTRFESEGFQFAKILPVSAYYIVHREEKSTPETEALCDEFNKAITETSDILEDNRSIVLSSKIRELLDLVINQLLGPMLADSVRDAQSKYVALEENQLGDFEAFLENGLRYAEEKFTELGMASWHQTSDIATLAGETLLNSLASSVSNAKSKRELAKLVSKKSLRAKIEEITSDLIARKMSDVEGQICSNIQIFLESFKASFNTEFRNLASDDSAPRIENIPPPPPLETIFPDYSRCTVSKSIFLASVAKAAAVVIFGVGGALIFSWIGAVVGTALGGLAGLFMGKTLKKYKQEVSNHISDMAREWGIILQDALFEKNIRLYLEGAGKSLNESINEFEQYKPQIEDVIRKEHEQQKMQDRVIRRALHDLRLLRNISAAPEFLFESVTKKQPVN